MKTGVDVTTVVLGGTVGVVVDVVVEMTVGVGGVVVETGGLVVSVR